MVFVGMGSVKTNWYYPSLFDECSSYIRAKPCALSPVPRTTTLVFPWKVTFVILFCLYVLCCFMRWVCSGDAQNLWAFQHYRCQDQKMRGALNPVVVSRHSSLSKFDNTWHGKIHREYYSRNHLYSAIKSIGRPVFSHRSNWELNLSLGAASSLNAVYSLNERFSWRQNTSSLEPANKCSGGNRTLFLGVSDVGKWYFLISSALFVSSSSSLVTAGTPSRFSFRSCSFKRKFHRGGDDCTRMLQCIDFEHFQRFLSSSHHLSSRRPPR